MNVNQADYLIPKEDYDELFRDYIELTLKNERLQNNWNELKQWLENHWQESQDIWFVKIIGKMQELGNDKEC